MDTSSILANAANALRHAQDTLPRMPFASVVEMFVSVNTKIIL